LKHFLIVAAIVAAGAGGWIGYQQWTASSASAAAEVSMSPGDAAVVALGKQVYADNCAACHGANLEGEPSWRQRKPDGRLPAPPHDPTGHTWHHADQLLFAITKYGVARVAGRPIESDMPAYEGVLSDREIAAALAYIKSTWPPEVLARQEAMTKSAAQN
jgi:mono/diheme cytochrome c family protein